MIWTGRTGGHSVDDGQQDVEHINMAECYECEEPYPDARKRMEHLGYARHLCVSCADTRTPVRAVKAQFGRSMVLQHKVGYVHVRTRADVRAVTTGKPNGGSTTEGR